MMLEIGSAAPHTCLPTTYRLMQVVKLGSPQANGPAAASPLVAAAAPVSLSQPVPKLDTTFVRPEPVAALERKSSTPEPAKPMFMYTTKVRQPAGCGGAWALLLPLMLYTTHVAGPWHASLQLLRFCWLGLS